MRLERKKWLSNSMNTSLYQNVFIITCCGRHRIGILFSIIPVYIVEKHIQNCFHWLVCSVANGSFPGWMFLFLFTNHFIFSRWFFFFFLSFHSVDTIRRRKPSGITIFHCFGFYLGFFGQRKKMSNNGSRCRFTAESSYWKLYSRLERMYGERL